MNGVFSAALDLLVTGDADVYAIVFRSLAVSACAILLAGSVALPTGYLLAHGRFAGRNLCITLIHTLTAVPTVVVGLLLFGLLSRQGALGGMGWLYTPAALVLGQSLLAFPLVATLTHSALSALDRRVIETARSLGAGPVRAGFTLLVEGRVALSAAVIAAFGRIVGEVGCALMVGGNIAGYTRTMSTAIALESGRGEFALSLALALVLLTVAMGINAGLRRVQGGR
ncbi:MAG: ABC transporter permease [Nitrospirota bacterium]|nr:ABC transporter permease [Nitrospirota bacterium]